MKFVKKSAILVIIFLAGMMSCKKGGEVQTLYIEEYVDTMNTKGKTSGIKKSYYTDKYNLIDDETQPYKVLINIPKSMVYLIDDKNSQYFSLTLAQFRNASQKSMGFLKDENIQIKATGKKKTIEGYECTGYVSYIDKIGLESKMWISGKIDAPMDLFYSFSSKSKIAVQATKYVSIMKKTNGYTIFTEGSSTKIPNFYSKITVKEIKGIKKPISFFAVPKDYVESKVQGL